MLTASKQSALPVWHIPISVFQFHDSVHLKSMSKIPTFMQQFKCLFHLSSCSTCFGGYIHPSSGASRMYRQIWYNSRLCTISACTFLTLLMMGGCNAWNMQSKMISEINTWIVASKLLFYSLIYDARNHETETPAFLKPNHSSYPPACEDGTDGVFRNVGV